MRWLLAFAVLITAMIVGAPRAGAQTYPGCAVEVSDVTVDPGDVITVSGTNAQPSEDVVAAIEGEEIGRSAADADGDFSFAATVPADLSSGTYLVEVTCGPSGAILQVTLAVGPAPAATGRLPKSGSDATIPFSRIAVALIAVGGLMALTSRRRATATRAKVPNLRA